MPVIETTTIGAAVGVALVVSIMDLLDLLDDGPNGLVARIPALTLLLLGLLGAQQAFERFGQLRSMRDEITESQQSLSDISKAVHGVSESLDQMSGSITQRLGDGRFDRALADVSSGLQAALQTPHPVFHNMIYRHLDHFRSRVNDWRDGMFRTRGEEYHRLLLDLYQRASTSVFSTSAQAYLSTWHTQLGTRLLAAHADGRAKVTRIFIFDRRSGVTPEAVAEMRRQSAVKNVAVRVYLKEEDPFFRFPSDISDDFTVIDEGEAIGTTVTFGDESRLTANWIFSNTIQKQRFADIVSALRSGSQTLAEFEAGSEPVAR
jgi:hypothetical protein